MAANIPVDIKRCFLSFIQSWFRTQHPTLVWNADPRLTKIFIGDKYIASPAIVEKMPSIILSRGTLSWAQTSIDQRLTVDLPFGAVNGSYPNMERTDLVRASVTFHCISQNGIEAESLANILFVNLVGHKDSLRKNGVHQILGISLGEENMIRGDVVPRLMSVPVHVMFTIQASVATTYDVYTISAKYNQSYIPYLSELEGFNLQDYWFGYSLSGQYMNFTQPPPSGGSLLVSYLGKYTLTQYTNITPSGVIDGLNTVFGLPEEVSTPYSTLADTVLGITVLSGLAI
jgi:hypothetical protein